MKGYEKYCLHICLFICFLGFSGVVSGQELFSIDSIKARMNKQTEIFPQEKIFVHTDKPLYISGEKVWFRAHLVESYTQRYDSSSLYIYGELINPLDSIVDRVKIRRENLLYAGYFALHEDYPAGIYSMRFYTKYMENMNDDYYFKKNIEIGGPCTAKFKTELECTYSDDGKKLNLIFCFIDQKTGERISPKNIAIAYNKEDFKIGNGENGLKKLKLNEKLEAVASLNISKEFIKSVYIEYKNGDSFHNEFVRITPPKEDFHVDFFPEGGHLLSGVHMNVAFKALGTDGLSIPITGVVCSENKDSLLVFNTVNKGMGTFLFYGESCEKYFVKCSSESGLTKIFPLPEIVPAACGLAVNRVGDAIRICHLVPDGHDIDDNLALIIHFKGRILFAGKYKNYQQGIQIKTSHLPVGIINCLLVNSNYEPVSERLFFNYKDDYDLDIKILNNKTSYNKRDKVISTIQLADVGSQPIIGNFSVSVTDDKDIQIDDSHNIASSLLLTSELKGYIEEPSFYFLKGTLPKHALDILMMTQGWRKYDIPKVLKGEVQHPENALERFQVISGDVRSGVFVNRKSKGIPIILLSLTKFPSIYSELSDANGRFEFMVDLPDSIPLIVRATTKKGGSRVAVTLDPERFPLLREGLPVPTVDKRTHNVFFEKADLNYLTHSGIRSINLRDIEVIANDLSKEPKRSQLSSRFNTVYGSDYFSKIGANTLQQALSQIGHASFYEDKVFLASKDRPAKVLVDDFEDELIISLNPSIDEIESIEIIKGSMASLFGVRGGGGVILIMTKFGAGIVERSASPLNIASIKPLGYQAKAQFYNPKYETVEQKMDVTPDLRTTLYWNPYVEVKDGTAEISFYTADDISTYTLLIEGVSSTGKPIHYKGVIGGR